MNLQLPPVARPPNPLNSDTDRRMAEISSGVRPEFLRSDNTEASADQPNTTNSLSLGTANISSAGDIVRYRLGEVVMQNNEPTSSSDVVNTTINDMSLNGTNNTTTNSDQSLKTIETLDQETTVNPTVTQQNNTLNALGASTTIGNDMITVNRTEKIKTSTVAMEMHTNVAVNESAVLDIVSTTANTPAPGETLQSDSTPNSGPITITTGSTPDASSSIDLIKVDVKPILPSCMSISCPQKCPLGYSLDKNQCPTCNCKGKFYLINSCFETAFALYQIYSVFFYRFNNNNGRQIKTHTR